MAKARAKRERGNTWLPLFGPIGLSFSRLSSSLMNRTSESLLSLWMGLQLHLSCQLNQLTQVCLCVWGWRKMIEWIDWPLVPATGIKWKWLIELFTHPLSQLDESQGIQWRKGSYMSKITWAFEKVNRSTQQVGWFTSEEKKQRSSLYSTACNSIHLLLHHWSRCL